MNILKKLFQTSESRLFVLLIILMIVISSFSPEFLTIENLFSITQQMSEFGILALGMTLVIITSGIDLSLGAIAGFTTIVVATVYTSTNNIWISIVMGLIIGIVCGGFNGFLVGKIGVPAILVTLGSMTLFNGFALAISKGNAISKFPDIYYILGQGYIGVIPIQTIIFVALSIVVTILLEKTPWGNYVYSIGNNPIATTFSGIKTYKILFFVYVFAGFFAAVSGIIISSRVATARADLGQVYVLQSVAAAVLGGTNISGGSGRIVGTFLGVTVLSVLTNGLNLIGINPFTQNLIMGLTLIIVLLINNFNIIRSKVELFIKLNFAK
jgi:ribose transport system permease protein/rhamnose transport system permease protein/inositol transport system permease protein